VDDLCTALAGVRHGPLRVLDLGTGAALIPIELCRRFPVPDALKVVAVDASPSMLEVAQRNRDLAGMTDQIELVAGDVENLPTQTNEFGVVTSDSLVHHLLAPLPALRQALARLRSGGLWFMRDLVRPGSLEQLDE